MMEFGRAGRPARSPEPPGGCLVGRFSKTCDLFWSGWRDGLQVRRTLRAGAAGGVGAHWQANNWGAADGAECLCKWVTPCRLCRRRPVVVQAFAGGGWAGGGPFGSRPPIPAAGNGRWGRCGRGGGGATRVLRLTFGTPPLSFLLDASPVS